MVEYCLDQGAVAVANPHSNKTALHLACENGHTDVVVALLNRLPALLMIDDSPGETSLHLAARRGHIKIVQNLLKVAEQTEVLKNSITVASEEEKSSGYLYDHKNTRHVMNEALPEIEIDVLARNASENRTPLHDAAISGSTETVQLLVDFLKAHSTSPRLGSIGGRTGNSSGPMNTFSSYNGSSSSRGKLNSPQQSNLDNPAFANPRLLGKRGVAVGGERVPGIDLSTLKGRTAFHEAARHQHYEVMEILLQAGADINAFMSIDLDPTINSDLTALVQACLMDQAETARFLLRHGAKDARLKALSRSLKGSLYSIAGILLCYNNQVKEVAADVRRALGLPSDTSKTFLQVMWNSKNLKFVCKEWLETVVTELPQFKDSLCAISHLDISSNAIMELPVEVFKLPFLTTLDISRNQIKLLPCEKDQPNGGWKCLRLSTLEAVSNQLSSLPSCLFRLGEVREINACSNKISIVPPSVWSAPKLCKLYLARNSLEMFPTPKRLMTEQDDFIWDHSDNHSSSVLSPAMISPDGSEISDSGYRSDVNNLSHQLDSVSFNLGSSSPLGVGRERAGISSFQLPYGPMNILSNVRTLDRKANAIQTQAVISRRLESFTDANAEVEELEELEETELETDAGDTLMLEVLDLSGNKLTSIPDDLCCLTPKLTKLNVSKNCIKSLGHINDYPLDLEFLDASSNELHTAIAPALSLADQRYHQPCGKKQFLSSPSHRESLTGMDSSLSSTSLSGTPSISQSFHKLCSHRTHKNLRKLSTLKLNHNHLVDLQLFRSVSKSSRGTVSDLVSSCEESSSSKPRSGTTTDPFSLVVTPPSKVDTFSKSINFLSRASALTSSKKSGTDNINQDTGKSSGSSPSEGSQDGSGSRGEGPPSPVAAIVISPLYPMLATLEVSHNRLHSVPLSIQHISTLSSLILNHNGDIDTLPLELSNLEHLWNLEYEGCPLTNPPKEDLDKFRLATDKLLYMRSLLHE